MGLGNAEPMKGENGAGYWVGVRNLNFYNTEFESAMLIKT